MAGVATLAGSVFYARKAAEIESNNAVLQSDIDSQNQAHRMVQAFARAQSQDVAPEGATLSAGAGGWADRVGGAGRASGSWVHRVEAQRQAEEAVALDALNVR